MVEPLMDVRYGTALLRRRWRPLARVAAAGAVLGAAYALAVPGLVGSTTLILLPPGANSTTEGEVPTQVRIVLSTPVLQKAGESVTPALTAKQVEARIAVQAPTTRLIEIVGFSRHAAEARALSQGVATAYIGALRDNASSVTALNLTDLRSREAELTTQVKDLQTEFEKASVRQRSEGETSVSGRREAQLLAQLTAEQADLSLQLDKVKESIAAFGTLGGASATSTIIQPAAPATGQPVVLRLVVRSAVGALVAAGGLAVALLVASRRDPRVRWRDAFADAVGSTVLASVASRPQRSVAEWLVLFESSGVSAVEAWTFRQALRALARGAETSGLPRVVGPPARRRTDHPGTVTVLAFSDDARGQAVGPQLAVFGATQGLTTRLVLAGRHETVASLRAACAGDRSSAQHPSLHLAVWIDPEARAAEPSSTDGPADGEPPGETSAGPVEPVESPEPVESADAAGSPPVELTVVLAIVDRDAPTLRGVPDTEVAVLAIAPGVATQEELARLAVAVDDTSRRIDGIVVADPDESDRTTGRRTLEERARRSPLPLRTTGIGQVPLAAGSRGRSR